MSVLISIQADAAVAELRRQQAAAVASTEPFLSWAATAQQKSVHKNVIDNGALVERWATTLRDQAELGRKPDGGSYGWPAWFAHGKELGASLKYLTGESYSAGFFTGVVFPTASATTDTLADAAEAAADVAVAVAPNLHWIVGGVAVVAVLVVAAPYLVPLARLAR